MIESLVSVKLPADEELTIKKNRLTGVGCEGGKRIAVVTGIHGDELEGQYVCYELVRLITANMAHLKGTVDIYPSINPLGMEAVSRAVPMSGLDMNRVFPGSTSGAVAENIAAKLVEDISGADVCVDIHASNIFIREIPQVRIPSAESSHLLKYAKMLNTDFVWVHDSNAGHRDGRGTEDNKGVLQTAAGRNIQSHVETRDMGRSDGKCFSPDGQHRRCSTRYTFRRKWNIYT